MVQSAEGLQIGNWMKVRLKSGNGRPVFRKLKAHDIVKIQDGNDHYIYEYIELSEEILLKAGFENAEDEDYLEMALFESMKILWLGYLAIEINGYFTARDGNEQIYLHQLQNLYFALKNEQLEIQL